METRCGFVAVIGKPNAGKSTLVNALTGEKVTIVSAKPQTTRSRILGIVSDDLTQTILIDTPGLFAPQKRLDRAMVQAAGSAQTDADLVVLVMDASQSFRDDLGDIIKALPAGKTVFAALNKVDAAPREKLLALTEKISGLYPFAGFFMISALKKDGTDDLLTALRSHLPPSPFLYDPELTSDLPARLLAAEITREKLFEKLYQEVPYSLTVETEKWENFDNGSIRIQQAVLVERDTQKAIILGHKGQMIRAIGEAARAELESLFETRVHLFLNVLVREHWQDDPDRYQPWGLNHKA